MEDKIKNENSEVDLRDYLKLIYSKKWLFLPVFFAPIIIAVIYNFSAPKIYEVSTWLEIGRLYDSKNLFELVENPVQIGRKINNGIYGGFHYNAVILNPNQTDLMQIKLESVDPEKAKNDLEKISEAILADHAEKIKIRRDALENEIGVLKNNVVGLEKEAKKLEAKLETPISQRSFIMTKDVLLRANKDVADINNTIASLKGVLDYVFNTRIVKPVSISDYPVKPRSAINIALAGMIGLFLGMVAVFLKKWREDYRG